MDKMDNEKSFIQKYWKLILFLLLLAGGIAAAIVISVGGGEGDQGGSFNDNNLGLFVFTLVDDQNKGLIVPVMITGDSVSNETTSSDWFTSGIIKGIEPIFKNNVFSVKLSDEVKTQIQSISFIASENNSFISPSFGTKVTAKQYNYIIMGQLNQNELELFELEKGVSDVLKEFEVVDSGTSTYNNLKTTVLDNLEFNDYCTDRKNVQGCKNL